MILYNTSRSLLKEGAQCSYTEQIEDIELQYDNMVKRTSVTVPNNGFVVVRFLANNPGLWMFHCHIFSHLVEGQALLFDVTDKGVPAVPIDFPTCPIHEGQTIPDKMVPLNSIGNKTVSYPEETEVADRPSGPLVTGTLIGMIALDVAQWFFKLIQILLF